MSAQLTDEEALNRVADVYKRQTEESGFEGEPL